MEPATKSSGEIKVFNYDHHPKKLVHEFGDDTTSLLHHDNQTRPMLEAAPGETLSFKTEIVEEEAEEVPSSKVSDIVELYQASSQKKRKADMKALKDRIQAKLVEKKLKKEQTISSRPPRYDEVFYEGVKWLDSLAGEPVEAQEGEISFGEHQTD